MSLVLKRARNVAHLTGVLVRDPRELRHVPPWLGAREGTLKTRQRSTVELRLPWLPFSVIERLQSDLLATSRVFEYGGGGSTLWFADRVQEVVTVEHDAAWYSVLQEVVEGLDGTSVQFRSGADDFREYVAAIQDYPDDHFDAVVVDGRERVRCLTTAMAKVRPGGLLLLDDSDRERYRSAFDVARDWPAETYVGLAPSKFVGTTTIWTKPSDA